MSSLLPPEPAIRITQSAKSPVLRDLETIDQLVVLMPSKPTAKDWSSVPKGARLKRLAGRRDSGTVPAISARLDNKAQTGLKVAFIGRKDTAFKRATTARRLASGVLAEDPARVAVIAPGFSADTTRDLIAVELLALLLGAFRLPAFRRKARRAPRLSSIRLFGVADPIDLPRVEAEAAANNLARWLTTMPPNLLDARGLREVAEALAEQHGWQCEFLGVDELKARGAGAFLAVASGNENDDAGIVHLSYIPEAAAAPPRLALVGKGIIFDTGGTNLKPADGMLDMHGDMQGSAVALGTLLALSRVGAPVRVDCWLAVTENRTGPRAYKQQDLITAANGKTIQVIHTDAEGRMVLADALTLCGDERPGLIIDYATLTGSCIRAITSRYSGIFTNRPDWHPVLKRAGEASSERVWPFPVTDEFREDLKSDVADMQQCRSAGSGDHIMAAVFLREFLPEGVDWVHLDLSAADHEGGLGAVPSKVTGFGVRYTLNLLLDQPDGPLGLSS